MGYVLDLNKPRDRATLLSRVSIPVFFADVVTSYLLASQGESRLLAVEFGFDYQPDSYCVTIYCRQAVVVDESAGLEGIAVLSHSLDVSLRLLLAAKYSPAAEESAQTIWRAIEKGLELI